MFTQLHSQLPVDVEGRGPRLAFAAIDYGTEHNLIGVTALDETGEIGCAPNPKVRHDKNWMPGLRKKECEDSYQALRSAK